MQAGADWAAHVAFDRWAGWSPARWAATSVDLNSPTPLTEEGRKGGERRERGTKLQIGRDGRDE